MRPLESDTMDPSIGAQTENSENRCGYGFRQLAILSPGTQANWP